MEGDLCLENNCLKPRVQINFIYKNSFSMIKDLKTGKEFNRVNTLSSVWILENMKGLFS